MSTEHQTMVRRYRRRSALVRTTLAITLSLMVSGSAAAGSAANSFCKDRIAHNYGLPFKSMPGLNQVPNSGRLSFASKSISFDTPAEQILVSNGSRFRSLAYGLTVPSGVELNRPVMWRMDGRLDQVSAQGAVSRPVETKQAIVDGRTARELDGSGFAFNLRTIPGFYRVLIEFRQDNGQLLKGYGDYFRVVAPTRHTSLALKPTRPVQAEEEVQFKVTNAGTLTARFGEAFEIDRRIANKWTPYPVDLGPWHQQLFGLGPGLSGACQRFTIPREMEAGQYRVRKEMHDPPHFISALFEVLGQ